MLSTKECDEFAKRPIKAEKVTIIIGKDFGEDLDQLVKDPSYQDKMPRAAIYFSSMKQLTSILTRKKMELFEYVAADFSKNVKEIAIELHRKDEAVSRDLKQLEKFGLIEMIRKGNKAYPRAKCTSVEIKL